MLTTESGRQERTSKSADSLEDNIEFFSSNFDLKAYISKRHKEEMNTGLGLLGLLLVRSMYGNIG